jgi:O-antigen polymerase
MSFKFEPSALASSQRFVGALCLIAAWLFPFYNAASRDALQQMFALASFGLASMLFGVSAVSFAPLAGLAVAVVWMAVAPSSYWGGHIAGVAGLVLAGVAMHVGANIYRKPAALHWLLVAIVVAAFCNAAEGLLQWFGLVPSLSPWVIEPERRGIAYGAFRQPNLFSTFLCVGVVCALWLVQARRLTETMAWFLLVVLVFAVAASGSRSGGLELAAFALAAWVWRKQQSANVTRLMVGPVLLFALATWVLPITAAWHGFDFVSGLSRVANAGQDSRFVLWRNAVDLILERPWAGWGWLEMGYGHYVTVFGHRFNELLTHAHNLFLQVAVEFGLPAALALFVALFWWVYQGQPWRINPTAVGPTAQPNQHPTQHAPQGRQFAWAILLAIGIHSMLELPLWSAGFLFLAGLAIGFLSPAPLASRLSPGYGVWAPRIAALCAVGLMVLAGVAWQQFAKVVQIYKAPFNDRVAQRAALAGASGAWLFKPYVEFAGMGLMEITPQNALKVRLQAEKLLHFAAEPSVIVPLLTSLWILKDTAALRFHAERLCRAFPGTYVRWRDDSANQAMSAAAGQLSPACDPNKP